MKTFLFTIAFLSSCGMSLLLGLGSGAHIREGDILASCEDNGYAVLSPGVAIICRVTGADAEDGFISDGLLRMAQEDAAARDEYACRVYGETLDMQEC